MRVNGEPLEIHTMPMPAKIVREGMRLPASYANFYIANKCVLLPNLRGRERRKSDIGSRKSFPDAPHRSD